MENTSKTPQSNSLLGKAIEVAKNTFESITEMAENIQVEAGKAYELSDKFAEGMNNYINKRPEIESMAIERLTVCKNCPVRTERSEHIGWKRFICDQEKGGCGCYLDIKVRVAEEVCPKNNW